MVNKRVERKMEKCPAWPRWQGQAVMGATARAGLVLRWGREAWQSSGDKLLFHFPSPSERREKKNHCFNI